jgi:uncharacterized protein (DUF2164 family)
MSVFITIPMNFYFINQGSVDSKAEMTDDQKALEAEQDTDERYKLTKKIA